MRKREREKKKERKREEERDREKEGERLTGALAPFSYLVYHKSLVKKN